MSERSAKRQFLDKLLCFFIGAFIFIACTVIWTLARPDIPIVKDWPLVVGGLVMQAVGIIGLFGARSES